MAMGGSVSQLEFGEKKLDVEVFVEVQVKHTESKEKVANAVSRIFGPQGEIRIEEDRVTYSSKDLESLRFIKDQFRDRHVRSAARRLLLSNNTELQTLLLFNKQAATVGIAAICDDPSESPLGPIVLRIRSSDVSRVIDWLTLASTGIQGYS